MQAEKPGLALIPPCCSKQPYPFHVAMQQSLQEKVDSGPPQRLRVRLLVFNQTKVDLLQAVSVWPHKMVSDPKHVVLVGLFFLGGTVPRAPANKGITKHGCPVVPFSRPFFFVGKGSESCKVNQAKRSDAPRHSIMGESESDLPRVLFFCFLLFWFSFVVLVKVYLLQA